MPRQENTSTELNRNQFSRVRVTGRNFSPRPVSGVEAKPPVAPSMTGQPAAAQLIPGNKTGVTDPRQGIPTVQPLVIPLHNPVIPQSLETLLAKHTADIATLAQGLHALSEQMKALIALTNGSVLPDPLKPLTPG